MQHNRKLLSFSLVLLGTALLTIPVAAQNLDSGNYTLVAPSLGDVLSGESTSTNYGQLLSSNPVDAFTNISTNYDITGGFARLVQANVPKVLCFETTTNTGSTTCTGLPGSDGMQGVCSEPGCYNRSKVEIDAQSNAADARYAIQISTTSDFSANVLYVDGTTRLTKPTLALADFLPKCEWEGTIVSGICGASNTTWQKYNILGLAPNTQYYLRISAQTGLSSDAKFSQSPWSPAATATTANPSLSLDIDIAPNTSTPTTPPYILNVGLLFPGSVVTGTDLMIVRLTSNALSGVTTNLRGQNGYLDHSSSTAQIPAFTGDLAGASSGYGLRNSSSTNSAQNTGALGSIVVSTTPIDFTDTGAAAKVGGPTTSFVKLFDSNSLPLDTGVSGYMVKIKPDFGDIQGVYTETLTLVTNGIF